jgi:hypothetical protein
VVTKKILVVQFYFKKVISRLGIFYPPHPDSIFCPTTFRFLEFGKLQRAFFLRFGDMYLTGSEETFGDRVARGMMVTIENLEDSETHF